MKDAQFRREDVENSEDVENVVSDCCTFPTAAEPKNHLPLPPVDMYEDRDIHPQKTVKIKTNGFLIGFFLGGALYILAWLALFIAMIASPVCRNWLSSLGHAGWYGSFVAYYIPAVLTNFLFPKRSSTRLFGLLTGAFVGMCLILALYELCGMTFPNS